MTLRAILFDLDGTLVQTRMASWELFAETNAKFNLGVEGRDAFFKMFEDNFFRAFETRCADKEKMQAAKEHFLALLRTRYCPELIPGIADVIRALAPHFALSVLSTNTMGAIRRTLEQAGIASCFAHVFAGDVEPDKSKSIRRFLSDRTYGFGRSCSPAYRETDGAERPNSDEVVLITDTVGDVKEARRCGIRAIGVAWGMHTQDQLLAAGAEKVAIWPQELIAWLVPEHAPDEPRACATGCACDIGAAPGAEQAEDEEMTAQLRAASGIRRLRRTEAASSWATAAPIVDASSSGASVDPMNSPPVQGYGTGAENRSPKVSEVNAAAWQETSGRLAVVLDPDVLVAVTRLREGGRSGCRDVTSSMQPR